MNIEKEDMSQREGEDKREIIKPKWEWFVRFGGKEKEK